MGYSILLAQGGLGNQLLQLCQVYLDIDATYNSIMVVPTLLESRTRRLRGVTRRSLSGLIPDEYLTEKADIDILVRAKLRVLELLTNNSSEMYSIIHNGNKYYKGDGLSARCFKKDAEEYWIRILNLLDRRFAGHQIYEETMVHMRHGDYASTKVNRLTGLYPLPASYYVESVERLQLNITNKNAEIKIFSDDPLYVKKLIRANSLYGWQCVSTQNPEKDLWQMTHAKNLIVSNSSYAAIAAHLCRIRNPSAQIIAPIAWFNNGKYNGTRFDLRLGEWILV